MSPELVGLAITGGLGLAMAIGAGAYAKTRDVMVTFFRDQAKSAQESAKESVEGITKEKDYWQGRHEDDRKEIHGMREQWNYDKLELERLRAETNFTPIDAKLTAFIEGQNRFNIGVMEINKGIMDRMDNMAKAQTEMTESFKRQGDIFVAVVQRLVPALAAEEAKHQEEPL